MRTLPREELDEVIGDRPLRILANTVEGPIHVYGDASGGTQILYPLGRDDVVEVMELTGDEVETWGRTDV